MDDYWVGWISNQSFEVVATYIETSLKGVSRERIVSVSHSSATVSGGWVVFSAVVVIANA